MKPLTFNADSFQPMCDVVATYDNDLREIIINHGYPPFWTRKPGFETLIQFILEQQVSLASAKAAMDRLKENVGLVTPEKLLALSDERLRACYFSRQKTVYGRALALAVSKHEIDFHNMDELDNDAIRKQLTAVKGIGNWTADVFLMMSLHRCDVFAPGDIALVKSIQEIKKLLKRPIIDEIEVISSSWKPYRTIAAYLLWHAYLQKRMKK